MRELLKSFSESILHNSSRLRQLNTPYCVVSNERKYSPKMGYSYNFETGIETTLIIERLERTMPSFRTKRMRQRRLRAQNPNTLVSMGRCRDLVPYSGENSAKEYHRNIRTLQQKDE
jgi:hypothetical protein